LVFISAETSSLNRAEKAVGVFVHALVDSWTNRKKLGYKNEDPAKAGFSCFY